MWISTKAQYGLRALIEIGKTPAQAVPLKDVAEKQDISQHYLEQIASNLRRAGFIRSVRGAHGGYRLSRAPKDIRAWDVVVTMEGSLAPVSCLEDSDSCSKTGSCATETLWKRVEDAVRDVLYNTTLEDLIRENVQMEHNRLVQLEPFYAPQ
ncbi:RrF2 family transcriptional regulator [Deinococcus roseus]|uniref:Rrf2 family transcriptional regulator n=1 Tax=Deinococcus roseus TaxID=392414 RepID=A0ABQ2CUC1_9DEIO|nr:RrF2 family transcriptional regulator [Deinococcus roseus]GGJ21423.1 Rrf2 family transcriptional regulator [Deinococcus roseus]